MRRDPYKERMYREWLIPRVIGGVIIFMIVLIVVILVQMNERSALINEGTTKSVPMLRQETVAKLGEIYIRKENEFESELKNIILGIANRKNKRGDEIYYGVNGKRNIDTMINDDYVNGVNLTYVKSDSKRADGESNFNDILAVLSSMYGADSDRYEDEVIEMFEHLFDISHTYNSESTELYPCEHGCAWTKYYCGDNKVVGTLSKNEGGNGEQVHYYKCDYYMGEEGKYGLMYDPFIIKKRSNYPEIEALADDENFMKTTAIVGPSCHTSFNNTNFSGTGTTYAGKGRVSIDDTSSDIFYLEKAEGTCPVCSEGKSTFTTTTKKFSGCVAVDMELSETNKHHMESQKAYNDDYDSGLCFHGSCVVLEDDKHKNKVPVWHAVGAAPTDCKSCEAVKYCGHIHKSSCENDEGEMICGHDKEDDMPLGCMGQYNCNGHVHYACPGHIVICCFGHTTLNLNVNILYHEGIMDELKKSKKSIS